MSSANIVQIHSIRTHTTQLSPVAFSASPIHRLSNELMSMIFAEVCKLYIDKLGMYNCVMDNSIRCPALALSWVSSYWRALALSTSELWTSLHVVLSSDSPQDKRLSFLGEFLSRSRSSPLRLYIEIISMVWAEDDDDSLSDVCSEQAEMEDDLTPSGNDSVIDDKGFEILHILVAHSDRWQDLVLETTVDGLIALQEDSVFTSIYGRLPVLQHLNLRWYEGEHDAIDDFHLFERAPSLRDVKITELCEPHATRLITLPWQQLKSLELKSCPYDTLTQILPQAIQLQTLKIKGGPEFQDNVPANNIQSDSVTSLTLCPFGGPRDNYNIRPLIFTLASLTLPNLKSLDINPEFTELEDWTELKGVLIFFMDSSRCQLTTLTLNDVPFDDSDGIELLRHTPKLENLSIRFRHASYGRKRITSAFLDYLDAGMQCAQNLKSLEFCVHATDAGEWLPCIVRIVKSRWMQDTRGQCLEALSITLVGDQHYTGWEGYLEVLKPLEEFKVKGLRQSLAYEIENADERFWFGGKMSLSDEN
ncbi:hypothetical protein VKT23_010376 [Stygiomarasmius scandens]|uniref:F-box domain-containing protein n=1 Tax=Marasmiellus scandens TaxID=2682957 RepID=A0ABR1JE16_9AGAR